MSPWQRMKGRWTKEIRAERMQLVRDRGIVIIPLSPLQSIVVKIGGTSTFQQGEKSFGHLTGDVIFGPAEWEDCKNFVVTKCEPLPDELRTVTAAEMAKAVSESAVEKPKD